MAPAAILAQALIYNPAAETKEAQETHFQQKRLDPASPQNPLHSLHCSSELNLVAFRFFYSSAVHKCGMDARLPRVYFRNSRILRHKKYFHSSSASLCVQWAAFDERRRPRMRPSSCPPLLRCHIVLRCLAPLALCAKPSCQIVRRRPFRIAFLRPRSARLGEDVCACASTATGVGRHDCPPQKPTDNRQ